MNRDASGQIRSEGAGHTSVGRGRNAAAKPANPSLSGNGSSPSKMTRNLALTQMLRMRTLNTKIFCRLPKKPCCRQLLPCSQDMCTFAPIWRLSAAIWSMMVRPGGSRGHAWRAKRPPRSGSSDRSIPVLSRTAAHRPDLTSCRGSANRPFICSRTSCEDFVNFPGAIRRANNIQESPSG